MPRPPGWPVDHGQPIIGGGGYPLEAKPFNLDTGEATPTEQYIFACGMVEVEVDTRTGQVDVLRSVLVDDVGKAVNPLFCEGQMDGGVAFGVAMALMEDFYPDYPNIVPVPRGFHEYKVMTALDMPREHTNVILEILSLNCPFGAKVLGEYSANLHARRSSTRSTTRRASGSATSGQPGEAAEAVEGARRSQEAGVNDVLLSWLLAPDQTCCRPPSPRACRSRPGWPSRSGMVRRL